MEILLIVVTTIVLLFGFVILFGAPYLPTLSKQVTTALTLVDLKPGDHLLELGCGDGKVLIAAATQGITVTGYELNPILALIAWLRTRRFRSLVTVHCANFWRVPLPHCDGIFVFLLPKYMVALDKKIIQETSTPVKLVSFAFKIPHKTDVAVSDGVYLYRYG